MLTGGWPPEEFFFPLHSQGNGFSIAFTFPSETFSSFPGVTIPPSSPFSLSFWQVHLSTHIWNCSPLGRQLSLEGPVPLLSGDQVNLQDFLSQDIPPSW